MPDQNPRLFDNNQAELGSEAQASDITTDAPQHGWVAIEGNETPAEGAEGISVAEGGGLKPPYLVSRTRAESTPQLRWQAILAQEAPPQSFLFEARARVDESSLEVPLRQLKKYWTTYADLDGEQLAWYYYWRSQFRQGNPLGTDLSYLMLNIYEALHLVGFQTPDEAFEYLHRLHLNYRQQHRSLDQYLSEWLTDMVNYYPISESLADRWSYERQHYVTGDEQLQHWIENRDTEELTSEVFRLLVTYRPEQNKFFRSISDPDALMNDFKRALELTDAWFFAEFNESVYTHLLPLQPEGLTRVAFARAVFEGPRYKYTVPGAISFRRDRRLIDLMTQVVRHAENLSRTKAGYSALLPDVQLPEGLLLCLSEYLQPTQQIIRPRVPSSAKQSKKPIAAPPPSSPPGQITIDAAHLAALQRESAAIRERLRIDLLDSSQVAEDESPALELSVEQLPQAPSAVQESRTSESAQVSEPDLQKAAERDPLEGFLASLPYLHLEVLIMVLLEAPSQADLATYALEQGTMASVLLEEINEYALEAIGDVLLDLDSDPPQVNAAYQIELMQLI